MTRSLFNALNVLKVFGAALVVASHYAGQYFMGQVVFLWLLAITH